MPVSSIPSRSSRQTPLGAAGVELPAITLARVTSSTGAVVDVGAELSSASGKITGILVVAGKEITLTATGSIAGKGLVFEGVAPEVGLAALIRQFVPNATLPDEVKDITLPQISIKFQPAVSAITLEGLSTTPWPLPFGVPGLTVSSTKFSFVRDATISCTIELKGTMAVEVVDGLKFESLSLTFRYGTGEWSLAGSAGVQVFDCKIALNAGLETTPEARKLTLRGTIGAVAAQDSVRVIEKIEKIRERDVLAAGKVESVTGAITVRAALDAPIVEVAEEAPFKTGPKPKKKQLPIETKPSDVSVGSPNLLSLQGIGAISVSEIGLTLSKSLNQAPTGGTKLDNASAYSWAVTTKGSLSLDGVMEVKGGLRLFKETDQAGLELIPEIAEVQIPLPIPETNSRLVLGLGALRIARAKTGSTQGAWTFQMTGSAKLTGLPVQVQSRLAETATAKLTATNEAVSITIDRILKPVEWPIPATSIGNLNVDLGKAALDISNFTLRKEAGRLGFTVDLGVGLPSKLNNLFGQNSDGTPVLPLFRTYISGKEDSLTRLAIGADTTPRLTFQCVNSPIQAIQFIRDETTGKTWCHADLGEFGKGKFLVPVFGYKEGGFSASGAFEITEPLKLPLTPVKAFFKACGLSALEKTLPSGLPLRGIHVFTPGGELNVAGLLDVLKSVGLEAPEELRKVLDAIKGQVDKLPDRFKAYLNVDIPTSLAFDLSLSTDGSVAIRVDASGAPLKYLYPTLKVIGGVPVHTLVGIQLNSLSVGITSGGALMTLQVDAVVDQFDLPIMAATLALPLDKLPLLPSTRSLAQTTLIRDLFMLVVYEAGVPIPIPLFFKQLGHEYLGLEGVEFQTHVGFPKPTLDLGELTKQFGDLVKFFTDRKFLLDANNPPKNMDLKLEIGPNYIQLPKYLGGSVLGTKTALTPISLYSCVAHAMNAAKTLDVTEAVQAIPVDYRVGKQDVALGPLKMQADWLITTPEEFKKVSYQHLGQGMPLSETGPLLAVLTTAGQTDDKGLVVFLQGQASLASASLKASFGLIKTDQGFGTGLRVSGRIGNLIDADLQGTVVIAPKEKEAFKLAGKAHLNVAGQSVFNGTMSLTDKQFAIRGDLNLFPSLQMMSVKGQLTGYIEGQAFLLRGGVAVSVIDPNAKPTVTRTGVVYPGPLFSLAGASFEMDNGGVRISGSWLGRSAKLTMAQNGTDRYLSGEIEPFRMGSLFAIENATGQGGPTLALGLKNNFPGVQFSGAARLLGLRLGLEAKLDSEGIKFDYQGKVDSLLNTALSCCYDKGVLSAKGSIDCTLTPIDTILGKIRLDKVKCQVHSDISLDMSKASFSPLMVLEPHFAATLTPRIILGEKEVTLSTISLNASPKQFKDIYDIIAEAVKREVNALVGAYTQVKDWIKAVVDKIIDFTGDVAEVAVKFFKAGIYEVVEAYKMLNKSITEVASAIKKAFAVVGDGLYHSLKYFGYAAGEIVTVMKNVFNIIVDDAAKLCHLIGFTAEQAGAALKSVYNLAADGLKSLLIQVGYAVSEVDAFLKSIGEFIENVNRDISNCIRSSAKPSKSGVARSISISTPEMKFIEKFSEVDFRNRVGPLLMTVKEGDWDAVCRVASQFGFVIKPVDLKFAMRQYTGFFKGKGQLPNVGWDLATLK